MSIPRAVAVVIDGEKTLIIKRYVREQPCPWCPQADDVTVLCPGHHYAVLPGGHVERDETAEDAALRELAEETTLRARIDRVLWTGLHRDRPATYFLMADVTGTAVLSGDEAAGNRATNSFELIWATPAQFDDLNLFPADIRGPLAELMLPSGGPAQ